MSADPPHGEDSLEGVTVMRPHPAGPDIAALPPPAADTHGPADIAESPPGCMNPLVRAASSLLLLGQQLRDGAAPSAPAHLRERAVAQIHVFERRARAWGIDGQTLIVARYALCAMLDEAVLNAPWGERSGWSGKTLLAGFHGETYGGEKFFQILERLCVHADRHIDLIELMYLCLASGFSGRYQLEPDGRTKLLELREDLYRRIHLQRAPVEDVLAPHWGGVETRHGWLPRYRSWWMPAMAGCVLAAALLYLQAKLDASSATLKAQVARIGLGSVVPPLAVPRKRLVELLASEASSGRLRIQEHPDGRISLHLNGAVMFSSGSVDVDPAQIPLLRRIARALNQVRGRVVVVGHTDDLPVRSPRFRDNHELSWARARAVALILGQGLDDSARLESSGAGDTEPVALPAGLAANRTRNRRVEIFYLPGAEP